MTPMSFNNITVKTDSPSCTVVNGRNLKLSQAMKIHRKILQTKYFCTNNQDNNCPDYLGVFMHRKKKIGASCTLKVAGY